MFTCNYCQLQHEDSENSVEHIIPQDLFNKSYVLDSVCIKKNNFMAISFENTFKDDPFTKEVLLLFSPNRSNKLIYRGEVKTRSGATESLFSQKDMEFLATRPAYRRTNKTTIKATSVTGEVFSFEITLPFEILDHANGSIRFIKQDRVIRELEEDKAKLTSYFQELRQNPAINPEFANFVKEYKIVPSQNTSANYSMKEETKSFDLVTDILPTLFPIDLENYSKFFMKIAWTHSCKALGRGSLNNPVGQKILSFLLSGSIAPEAIQVVNAASVGNNYFRSANIASNEVFFWLHPPSESLALFKSQKESLPEIAATTLSNLLTDRNEFFKSVASFITFNKLPEILSETIDPKSGAIRHHSLFLEIKTNGVFCNILLFGGVFDVTIQVSSDPVTIPEEAKQKIISF